MDAKHQNGGMTHGRDDSGGPVFTITGDAADVVAVGMITAGEKEVPCGNRPSDKCYRIVSYTPLQRIRDNLQATNVTRDGLK